MTNVPSEEVTSKRPIPVKLDLGRTNLTVNQRCGACKHLRRIAHAHYEKPCKDLGITEISQPCIRFAPDPSQIRLSKSRLTRNLVESVAELSPAKLRLLASILNQEARTRKYGFHLGQKVYLRAFGDDYLSNYRRATVVSADRKYVNIETFDGITAMVFHTSVMSATQWRRKRKQLIQDEKIKDPKYSRYIGSQTRAKEHLRELDEHPRSREFDYRDEREFLTESERKPRRNPRLLPITELIIRR